MQITPPSMNISGTLVRRVEALTTKRFSLLNAIQASSTMSPRTTNPTKTIPMYRSKLLSTLRISRVPYDKQP